MPLLDVTDVLYDPDFCQDVVVETTVVTTNDQGVASKSVSSETISAVVTPLTTRELMRLPEGEMLKGGITVFSHYPLQSGDGNKSADTIVWNGVSYVVYSTDDYSTYGEGFNVAVCQLLSVRGSK